MEHKIIQPLTVGLVENEKRYRDYICEILNHDNRIASVITWKSAEEYWRDERGFNLNLIFIDILLNHMNGVELNRLINERNPEILKVMLTNIDSEEMIFKALRYGAVGYILKSELDDITSAIQIIAHGGAIISPTIACRVLNTFNEKPVDDGSPKLTTRERQVLEQLIQGMTKKKAADCLGISEETLRWHVKNIYRKLNVTSKLEMIRKSEQLRLV